MTYNISKEFAFSASHQLAGLPADHQCARMHGHNYIIKIALTSDELDKTGFILDYGQLAPVKHYIDNRLDHRHLNDVVFFNPTAENLARYLAEVVMELLDIPEHTAVSVGVSETPKTWAWWTP